MRVNCFQISGGKEDFQLSDQVVFLLRIMNTSYSERCTDISPVRCHLLPTEHISSVVHVWGGGSSSPTECCLSVVPPPDEEPGFCTEASRCEGED